MRFCAEKNTIANVRLHLVRFARSVRLFSAMLVVLLCASCKSNLTLRVNEKTGAVTAEYSASLGAALRDTLGALTGEDGGSIFDTEQIAALFTEAGLRNVRAESKTVESLIIRAESAGFGASAGRGAGTVMERPSASAQNAPKATSSPTSASAATSTPQTTAEPALRSSDFIQKSQLLTRTPAGKVELRFSAQTLNALYDSLPPLMQSYIEMFMAPTFTYEKMTDDEYAELIAAVYGQTVSDELKNATITVVLEKIGGGTVQKSVPLLDLLNIKGDITLLL